MRKFAAVVAVVLALMVVPRAAGAAPIGTNTCAQGGLFYECDIFADFDDGVSELGPADGLLGGYLVGYTFLLNAGADLDPVTGNGFDAVDVAHILVIHNNLLELYSNIATSLVFSGKFNEAKTGAAIDGTTVTAGQTAGCPPVPSGVPNIGGVGYCTSADTVTVFPDFNDPLVGTGNDLLRIHTALSSDEEPPTTPVPEPGTLTLLGFGGSAAAAAVRRRRAAKTS